MTPLDTASMLADLERLACCESPSADVDALHRCADLLIDIGNTRLGTQATRTLAGGKPVVRFGPPDPAVLLLGHLDTVHPIGTLATAPFRVRDGRVHGPGVLDMKGGLVQALHALAAAEHGARAGLLVTADEELGSPDSRQVIEAAARDASAVLVLEAASAGSLKTARKGVSRYRLELTGRAAHAGLEPELGANACVALAHAVLAVADLADETAGTTVTPTVASAGTTVNTVPDRAAVEVDVRAATAQEQERVDGRMRSLPDTVGGVFVKLHGGVNRGPLEQRASARLFALAQEIAADQGLAALHGASVGGGSDGNFTAAVGVDTLDGLGAVGDGAHTVDEWADVSMLAERAGLVAGMVDRLIAGRRQ